MILLCHGRTPGHVCGGHIRRENTLHFMMAKKMRNLPSSSHDLRQTAGLLTHEQRGEHRGQHQKGQQAGGDPHEKGPLISHKRLQFPYKTVITIYFTIYFLICKHLFLKGAGDSLFNKVYKKRRGWPRTLFG